jgi:DNA-binding NarL/FixJ family response regulator
LSANVAKSVLIVDDSQIVRNALSMLFTWQPDFGVCGEAQNGREAIEKAQQLHPDLIIMDLSMPLMNGLDAARALRGLMPTVPIIMYSNYSECLGEGHPSAGISAMVSKSDNVSTLLTRARTLVEKAA